jgi:hypothetical protein
MESLATSAFVGNLTEFRTNPLIKIFKAKAKFIASMIDAEETRLLIIDTTKYS